MEEDNNKFNAASISLTKIFLWMKESCIVLLTVFAVKAAHHLPKFVCVTIQKCQVFFSCFTIRLKWYLSNFGDSSKEVPNECFFSDTHRDIFYESQTRNELGWSQKRWRGPLRFLCPQHQQNWTILEQSREQTWQKQPLEQKGVSKKSKTSTYQISKSEKTSFNYRGFAMMTFGRKSRKQWRMTEIEPTKRVLLLSSEFLILDLRWKLMRKC